MTRPVCLAVLLTTAVLAFSATRQTVLITDTSDGESPIKFSGEVTVEETPVGDAETSYAYHEHIVGMNVSAKTVLALVTTLEVSGSVGNLVSQQNLYDSFFSKEEEIPPGKQFVHTEHGNSPALTMPSLRKGVDPLPAHSEISLVYVEFTDGTTYGNQQHKQVIALLEHRAHLLEAYQSLNSAANQSDETFLRQLGVKINDPFADGAVENQLREFQRKQGTAATISALKEMLSIASGRQVQ